MELFNKAGALSVEEFRQNITHFAEVLEEHLDSYSGKEFDKVNPLSHEFGDGCSGSRNILKLKRGRIAGFIMDRYDLSYKVKTQELYRGLKIHPFFVNQNDVFFGFSKKSVNPELLARLQRAYIRIRAKGVLKEITMQYQ